MILATSTEAQNKYIVKNCMLWSTRWWPLPLFCYVLLTKPVFLENNPVIHVFSHQKSFLWKGSPLTVKIRKKAIDQILSYISFYIE